MTRLDCRKCHRPLRSALWRARGIGPVCARRAGLVASRRCRTVLVRSVRAEQRAYRCRFCFGWHLTSEPEKGAA